MFLRSKKLALAVEWIWLVIGTAVVFVHLVEAWAVPYLPMVWMLGVVVLFVGYRAAVAVREMYWPSPDPEEPAEELADGQRRGGDGMVSTTEWVPPQSRGRKREMRAQARQQNTGPQKLELPSESDQFDGAEVATVFAEVDDDTEPDSTMELEIVDRPSATEIVDLRPETDADVTTGEITIPSFAESTLTIRERDQALEALRDRSPADEEAT